MTRAAAANLATRLGWQAVDIDSLRLAIDEAFVVLVGDESSDGQAAGDLVIDFVIIDAGLDLTIAHSGGPSTPIPADRLGRFNSLIAPGFAEATVDVDRRRVHIIKKT